MLLRLHKHSIIVAFIVIICDFIFLFYNWLINTVSIVHSHKFFTNYLLSLIICPTVYITLFFPSFFPVQLKSEFLFWIMS